jgi:hypothetical protein
VFTSRLQRSILEIDKDEVTTYQQLRSHLKTQGVTSEEMYWTGLADMIADQTGDMDWDAVTGSINPILVRSHKQAAVGEQLPPHSSQTITPLREVVSFWSGSCCSRGTQADPKFATSSRPRRRAPPANHRRRSCRHR